MRGVTAVFGALVVAAACVACSNGSSTQQGEPSDVSAALDGLVLRIDGGAVEQNAAAYLENEALQGGYQRCMAEQGFAYPRRPFTPPESDEHITQHRGTEWLEPLGTDFGIARFKVAYRAWGADWQDSSYLRLSDEDQRAYGKALTRCERSEADWVVQAEPAISGTQADQLSTVLATADEAAASRADEYAQCLHDLGYQASTYTELYREVWRQYPTGLDAPVSVAGGDTDWRQAMAFEADAAAADASCRSGIYGDALATVADDVAAFASDHADKLAQLDQQWREVAADARAAGFGNA